VQIPTLCPSWGRWGLTLTGALSPYTPSTGRWGQGRDLTTPQKEMSLLGTAVICEQTKPLPIGTQGNNKNLVLANTPHLGTILLANPQYTPCCHHYKINHMFIASLSVYNVAYRK